MAVAVAVPTRAGLRWGLWAPLPGSEPSGSLLAGVNRHFVFSNGKGSDVTWACAVRGGRRHGSYEREGAVLLGTIPWKGDHALNLASPVVFVQEI